MLCGSGCWIEHNRSSTDNPCDYFFSYWWDFRCTLGTHPALLKIFTGASEVITTMMMSYIASHLTSYLVNYRFKAPGWVAQTNPVQPSAILVKILPPTQLSVSFLISLGFSLLVFYFLFKTYLGYQVCAVGLNPTAAENRGISVHSRILMAFLLSAFVAGVGGAGEVLGVHGRFVEGSSPGYGWDGIAVSLVDGSTPLDVSLHRFYSNATCRWHVYDSIYQSSIGYIFDYSILGDYFSCCSIIY